MSSTCISHPTEKLDIETQCLRKVQFPTFWSALKGCHVIVAKEASRGNYQPFAVYICPHCYSYHVGKVSAGSLIQSTHASVAQGAGASAYARYEGGDVE